MSASTLLFVINRYFPFGGLQRDMLRLAQACIEKGNHVSVITGDWQGDKPEGLQVIEVDISALTIVGKVYHLARSVACIRSSYDCVVGFNKMPGLDIYYAGDPCYAARAAERSLLYRMLPRYRGLKALEASVFSSTAGVVLLLIAHQEKAKFIHHYQTPDKCFHLLPPGIDKQRLLQVATDSEVRQRLRKDMGIDDGFFVLTVGSSFSTKGVDRSLRAFAALPEEMRQAGKLVVVGSGDEQPYKKLAQDLDVGEQVVFTGPRDDVAGFYYAADVLLHPAYTENTGTTLLEAMVCGLPVLATANCGYAIHVARAGAGLVCPMPFEQGVLNAQLATMLTSDERTQWREHGLCYSREQDLYGMVDAAVVVIETITAAKQGEA